MTYPLLPDTTQALIDFLTAHPDLVPLHGGRVSTRLQSDLTCVQVTPLGGQQPWPWEATPEFSLSSWGGTEGDAHALDLTIRAVVFDLVSQAITGGRVVGVAIRLGGLWSPADDTGRPRVRSDVALTVMP